MNNIVLQLTEFISYPLVAYMIYTSFLCFRWAHKDDTQRPMFFYFFLIQCAVGFLYLGNNFVYHSELTSTLTAKTEISWRLFHYLVISTLILKNQQTLLFHEYAERRLKILFYNTSRKSFI